jgi:ABC-type Na+ efflux pump permease subunit
LCRERRNFARRTALNRNRQKRPVESYSKQKRELEQDICIHIFTVSSAMVGVCLTVIGLVRVVITLGTADTIADDLLAADALLFLVSCFLSYGALRSRGAQRMHRIERAADAVFILAMVVMVAICAFLTYAISAPTHA